MRVVEHLESGKMTLEYMNPKTLKNYDYSRKLFPALEGDPYELLKADIIENGIRTPIEINKNNLILCGHERNRVALELGLKEVPITRFGNGSETSEVDEKLHLIQDNLARKAVDERTRTVCAIEMDKLYGLKRGEHHGLIIEGKTGFQPIGRSTETPVDFLTTKQIAEKTKISVAALKRAKRIEKSSLPEEIKKASFDGRLARRPTSDLIGLSKPIYDVVVKQILEKLRTDEPIYVERIINDVTQNIEAQQALEKAGIPSVGEQVDRFYAKIAVPPAIKPSKPSLTNKGVIHSVLVLLEKNAVVCSVCGEKHLKWSCGHTFQ